MIGIDAYQAEGWGLSGAVADAVRFASWVRERGVHADDLTLLLSPSSPEALEGVQSEPATALNLRRALQTYTADKRGEDAKRLYFYFSGHGVSGSLAALARKEEPCLVPADVESLALEPGKLLSFDEVMTELRRCDPREQLFFIDACRAFALEEHEPGIGGSGRWQGRGVMKSHQAILYAVAAGQIAQEVAARGVFGGMLLDTLRGQGGARLDVGTERYELRFDALCEAVQQRVTRQLLGLDGASMQLPQTLTIGWTNQTPVAQFDPNEIPSVRADLRVTPRRARTHGELEVRLRNIGRYTLGARDHEVILKGPLGDPHAIELPRGHYTVLAAVGREFVEKQRPWDLWSEGNDLFELSLTPSTGLEALPLRGTTAPLRVSGVERHGTVRVFDERGESKHEGTGNFELLVAPGNYRVVLERPGGPPETHWITAGERPVEVSFQYTPDVSPTFLQQLERVGMTRNERGHLQPFDGPTSTMADIRLSALLALSAFAATWPRPNELHRLRAIGVRVPWLAADGSGLLVLVAASSPELAAELLPSVSLALAGDAPETWMEVGLGDVAGLGSLARQGSCPLSTGNHRLRVHLAGRRPTTFSLAALPGRLTVFTVALLDRNDPEVRQYAFRHPADPGDLQGLSAERVRVVELFQRAYEYGGTLEREEIDAFLYAKWLDPILGCIVMHRLLAAEPDPLRGPLLQQASQNLLRYFGELPDVHTIAALVEPEQADRHFEEARKRGTPVLLESYRALPQEKRPPQLPGSALLSGSMWTTWVDLP